MPIPRIAVLATASAQGELGGAERFYLGLRDALADAGMVAEILPVTSDESDFSTVLRSYLRFYELDLRRFDGVISTKAPAYLVRHPRHVCYLQHTLRVFYDMFEREFPEPTLEQMRQRRLIRELDTAALANGRLRGRFVIGRQVRERLLAANGLDAEVLYQGSTLAGCRTGRFEHLFLPGRLHRWKRVGLVIEAMRHVTAPVPLLIVGTGEDEGDMRRQAAGDPRIRFLGRVSDARLAELYADALAVAFVPELEDFGLVTLEAFQSGKPVLTCTDSGEPARIVRDGASGWVCPPEPAALARRIDALWRNREAARAMGAAGRASIAHITWQATAERLLEALDFGATGSRSALNAG